MLLVALSLPDEFRLPYEFARDWYGVSPDSAEEGLRELRNAGLLDVEQNWVPAPRSETGWTAQLLYTLNGSFSKVERAKAARSRGAMVADEEASASPIAPVVPMPAVDKVRPA